MFGDCLIFYDSDILSSFLGINRPDMLKEVFNKILVPSEVKKELFNPNTPKRIRNAYEELEDEGFIETRPIHLFTPEADYFFTLINNGEDSIGSGEAAVISLAIVNNGIVASNNFRDICKYIKEYDLEHVATSDIIFECYQRKFITRREGDRIWKYMMKNRMKLPFDSFSEFLDNYLK